MTYDARPAIAGRRPARWGLWWGSLEGADLVTLADAAAGAGFASVSATPAMVFAAQSVHGAALRRVLDDIGVEVAMIDPLIRGLPGAPDPESVDPRWRSTFDHDEDDCHRAADAVGARLVNVAHFLGTPVVHGALVEAVGAIAERAARRGRSVAVEAMPEGGIVDVRTAAAIVRDVALASCGLTLDTWHWWRSGGDLDELRALPAGTIRAVQVADAAAAARGSGRRPPSRDRLLPGAGVLPLGEIVALVDQAHPDALWGVEVFDRANVGRPPAELAAALSSSVRDLVAATASRARAELDAETVEVVVVPRERYGPTIDCLRVVLAAVPDAVRVTLVRGGMPDAMVEQVRAIGPGRVRVVGPARHLAPNAARSIGLHAATARYVVFVDNDVEPQAGLLESLVATAEARDAWVVRPIVLQRAGDDVRVHESGGDCHLEHDGAIVRLVETHRHLGAELHEVAELRDEAVELFEFHAVLFDRDRLVALGGPDERVRSLGDHLDLALRVHDAGGSIWLAADAAATYVVPHRLALRDLPFFLGRWSPSWTVKSRTAFLETHGVNDPDDPYETWLFADLHRSYAWLPLGRAVARVSGRPVARGVARRFDRHVGRRLVPIVQALAPRWRGDGGETVA